MIERHAWSGSHESMTLDGHSYRDAVPDLFKYLPNQGWT